MTSVIFQESTIKSVKEQFTSERKRFPIDTNEMNFRLYKTKSATINLELLCRNDLGFYFKPICVYMQKDSFLGIFNKKIQITILNEFYNDYEYLLKNQEIEFKGLDIIELGDIKNFLIGAFSRETYSLALQMFKLNIGYKSIIANGFKFNLSLTPDQEHIIVNKGDIVNMPIIPCGYYKQEDQGFGIYSPDFKNEFEELLFSGLVSALQDDE